MNKFLSVILFTFLIITQASAKGTISNGPFGEFFDYGSGYEMPEYPKRKPNMPTLHTYLKRYIDEQYRFLGFKVPQATNPYKFKTELREEPFIKKQLQKTALLSYLLFEDGKIVVDELTPNDRFGSQVSNDTPLPSRSIGKSLTSYLLGHAICTGFIDGIDTKLDDWDWIIDTVYENQQLIDLINMRAGDQAYASANRLFLPNNQDRNTRWQQLAITLKQLRGTTPGPQYYNYNDLAVNTVTNYIRHKTGNKYKEFTTNFLHKKVGIASPFYFMAVDNMRVEPDGVVGTGATISNFSASRYDFLRIARSMLNDWQNDTCEGKYLKTIFERKMRKDTPDKDFQQRLNKAKYPNKSFNSYGGYFHMGLFGTDKKRNIIGMDGFGGQMIWIDFDKGRIVVTNAIYNNYNWKRIVRDVIRKGKISSANWN